jgi:Zn-finger nucleic acid-binding protein
MNRQNFARISGVVLDVCKDHGVWFNHGELTRIVEFIRGGGLGRARELEKLDLQEERERLHHDQMLATIRTARLPEEQGGGLDLRVLLDGISGVLDDLFRKK